MGYKHLRSRCGFAIVVVHPPVFLMMIQSFEMLVKDKKILTYLTISLVFLMLYSFFIADGLTQYFGLDFYKDKVFDVASIVSAVIFAPLLEELIFRLPLSSDSSINWMLFIPIVLLLIVFYLTDKYLVTIPLLLLIYTIYLFVKHKQDLSSFYTANKIFWIVVVSVIFSFCHIILLSHEILEIEQKIILVSVVFLPLSFCLAFFRTRYGILSSILLHALFNLSTLILNHLVY